MGESRCRQAMSASSCLHNWDGDLQAHVELRPGRSFDRSKSVGTCAGRRLQLASRRDRGQYYWDTRPTGDLLELRNIADVAWLTVQSSRLRQESRGLHYNLDYPRLATGPAEVGRDSLLWKRDGLSLGSESRQLCYATGTCSPVSRR